MVLGGYPSAMTSSEASSGSLVAIDDYGSTANQSYDAEMADYTDTLSSTATDFKFLNGRRYHAYKEGKYIFPNDDVETDRLDMTHKMCEVSMHGRLYNSPLENPQRILDLGTGTGIWAMEISELFPNAMIIGNDLSPIQPNWVPPNVHFEIDDIESKWAYSEPFDFIHARALYAAISDWPTLVRQCYENVNPGGYVEFTDFDLTLHSPDNSIHPDSPLQFHNNTFRDLALEKGTEPCPGRHLDRWLRAAGFEDVHVVKMPLPIGTWAKDKHLKEVGCWNFLQMDQGLESFISHIFATQLGWDEMEIKIFCMRIRDQVKNPRIHGLVNLYNAYGRRPLQA